MRPFFAPHNLRGREDNVVFWIWTVGIFLNEGRRCDQINLTPIGVDYKGAFGYVGFWVAHNPVECVLDVVTAVVNLRIGCIGHEIP